MSMRIGPLDLHPTLGLTLAAVVVIAVCSALGVWQLSRAEEKAMLADLLQERFDSHPQPIDSLDFTDIDAIRYSNVRAAGRFDYAHQFHIPHRQYRGRTGLHIITPFIVSNTGKRLLVNRGWIAQYSSSPSDPPTADTRTETLVSGRLIPPARPPLRLGPANSDATPWHRPWLFADPELFASASGAQAYPLLLLLETDKPGGPQRDWVLPQPDPSMHYGYALQWFAFAAIALAVWGALSHKRSGNGHAR